MFQVTLEDNTKFYLTCMQSKTFFTEFGRVVTMYCRDITCKKVIVIEIDDKQHSVEPFLADENIKAELRFFEINNFYLQHEVDHLKSVKEPHSLVGKYRKR